MKSKRIGQLGVNTEPSPTGLEGFSLHIRALTRPRSRAFNPNNPASPLDLAKIALAPVSITRGYKTPPGELLDGCAGKVIPVPGGQKQTPLGYGE